MLLAPDVADMATLAFLDCTKLAGSSSEQVMLAHVVGMNQFNQLRESQAAYFRAKCGTTDVAQADLCGVLAALVIVLNLLCDRLADEAVGGDADIQQQLAKFNQIELQEEAAQTKKQLEEEVEQWQTEAGMPAKASLTAAELQECLKRKQEDSDLYCAFPKEEMAAGRLQVDTAAKVAAERAAEKVKAPNRNRTRVRHTAHLPPSTLYGAVAGRGRAHPARV